MHTPLLDPIAFNSIRLTGKLMKNQNSYPELVVSDTQRAHDASVFYKQCFEIVEADLKGTDVGPDTIAQIALELFRRILSNR